MILLVVLPSAKAGLEIAYVGKLMKEITKRFTAMANISILILISTGILIAHYDENFALGPMMISKHLLVALMVAIHIYRILLTKKIERMSLQEVDKMKKFSLNLIKTNLVLGIIVLLLTGISLSLSLGAVH
ncbi:CopD family protein [bacterium]|nr:CopD family protein [bacterium]